MVVQDEVIFERLRALREKSGMTLGQVAEKANMPESTVNRILSGKTRNPTIINVVTLVKAMGGTLADVFDDDAKINTQLEVPQAVVSDIERKNMEVIELYKSIIASKDKTIKLLTYVLLGVSSVIIFLLLFDLFNGGIGYFRA